MSELRDVAERILQEEGIRCRFCRDTGIAFITKPMGFPITMVTVPTSCRCAIPIVRNESIPDGAISLGGYIEDGVFIVTHASLNDPRYAP